MFKTTTKQITFKLKFNLLISKQKIDAFLTQPKTLKSKYFEWKNVVFSLLFV